MGNGLWLGAGVLTLSCIFRRYSPTSSGLWSVARGLARGLRESSKGGHVWHISRAGTPTCLGRKWRLGQESGLFLLLDNAQASQTGFSFVFVYVELVQTQVKLWYLNF